MGSRNSIDKPFMKRTRRRRYLEITRNEAVSAFKHPKLNRVNESCQRGDELFLSQRDHNKS